MQKQKAHHKALANAPAIYKIGHGEQTEYLLESDIDQMFQTKDIPFSYNKVKVTVMHPDYKIDTIKGIDIDRQNVTSHSL